MKNILLNGVLPNIFSIAFLTILLIELIGGHFIMVTAVSVFYLVMDKILENLIDDIRRSASHTTEKTLLKD